MKIVILAGGFGTRLSEYTENIPKPMVPIGGRPIIEYIMETFSKFGHKDFFVALGYKGQVMIDHFKNTEIQKKNNWNINLIDTGSNTMTGGRVKRMEKYIGDETFLLTYGDGLANINIKKLIDFHEDKKKMLTISAVRPPARFGALQIDEKNNVMNFREKNQLDESWINGGYMVVNPEIFNLIRDDQTVLEKEVLENLSKKNNIIAFKHEGFWQCMDHKLDKDKFDEMIERKEMPWLKD